jgi:hypothetical protein
MAQNLKTIYVFKVSGRFNISGFSKLYKYGYKDNNIGELYGVISSQGLQSGDNG